MDLSSPEVIAADGKKQQQHEHTAGLKIKEQADKKQVNSAELVVPVNKRIKKEHQQKKGPEEQMREEQWLVL